MIPIPQSVQKIYYGIDLNDIYEILPNQEWGAGRERHSEGIQSVHQTLIVDLTCAIWKAVQYNKKNAHTRWVDGWNNLNYFITGSRGTGKSTFLRYICKCITGEADAFAMLPNKRPQGYPLNIRELYSCDPTAMPEKENFFVDIVAAIKKLLTSPAGQVGLSPAVRLSGGRHAHGTDEDDGAHYHDVSLITHSRSCMEMLDSLARGIKQMSKQNSHQSDREPLALLNADIKDRTSSISLKRQFDDLINKVAESYGVDAFYVAIDDADIHSTSNLKILETIRTYLTHPRIIILFTGDKRLINEVLRQRQYEQFMREFHNDDAMHGELRWRIIETMAAQYIKKVFPPTNYFQLPSLWDVIQEEKEKAEYVLIVSQNGKMTGTEPPIRDYVRDIFLKSIVVHEKHADILVEGFFRLPIRSIMHTLRYWKDRDIEEKRQKVHTLQTQKSRQELARMLCNSFCSSFFSELFSQGFRKRDLELYDVLQTSRGLLMHCAQSKDGELSHRLVTSNTCFEQQESTLTLVAKAAATTKSVEDILTYIIFGSFAARVFCHLRSQSHSTDTGESVFQSFINELYSDHSESPTRWLRKLSQLLFTSGLQGREDDASILHGIFRVKGAKDIEILEGVRQRVVEDLFKTDRGSRRARLIFDTSLVMAAMVGKGNTSEPVYYISPYNLLGLVLDCIRALARNKENALDAVQTVLRETLNLVLYNNESSARIDVPQAPPYEKALVEISKEIIDWFKGSPPLGNIDAIELGELADILYHVFETAGRKLSEGYSYILDVKRIVSTMVTHVQGSKSRFYLSMVEHLATFPLMCGLENVVRVLEAHVQELLRQYAQRELYIRNRQKIGLNIQEARKRIALLQNSIQERIYGNKQPGDDAADNVELSFQTDTKSSYKMCSFICGQWRTYDRIIEQLSRKKNELKNSFEELKAELSRFPREMKSQIQENNKVDSELEEVRREQHKFREDIRERIFEAFRILVERMSYRQGIDFGSRTNELSHLQSQLGELHIALSNYVNLESLEVQMEPLLAIFQHYRNMLLDVKAQKQRNDYFDTQLSSHPVYIELWKVLGIDEETVRSQCSVQALSSAKLPGEAENENNHKETMWQLSCQSIEKAFKECSDDVGKAITKTTSAFCKNVEARITRLTGMKEHEYRRECEDITDGIVTYMRELDKKQGIFISHQSRVRRSAYAPDMARRYLDFASSFGLHKTFGKERKRVEHLISTLIKAEKRRNSEADLGDVNKPEN